MLGYRQIIENLIERIRILPEKSFQTNKVASELSRFSDFEIANLLEEIYKGAIQKQDGYIFVLEALTDFAVVKDQLGTRLSGIFDIADSEGLLLAAEWLAPLPIKQKRAKNLFVHNDLMDLTLGERKWHARKADPLLLEKLLVDPEPTVIYNLLNHSQITEKEVVKICAKTPNNPEVMMVVYNNKKWFSRYQVKKALLNNPATPPRLVMLLLVWLSRQDLKDLKKSKRFSPGFIDYILSVRSLEN